MSTSPVTLEHPRASVSQDETDVLEQIYKHSSILFCCIGLLSNSIIIATLVKTNKFKLSSNVYFMAIAIFDNFYLLFYLIYMNVYHDGNSYTHTSSWDSAADCMIVVWGSSSLSTFSIHAQTALACDRCYVMLNPYKPKPTRKHALICICIIVSLSMCVFIRQEQN